MLFCHSRPNLNKLQACVCRMFEDEWDVVCEVVKGFFASFYFVSGCLLSILILGPLLIKAAFYLGIIYKSDSECHFTKSPQLMQFETQIEQTEGETAKWFNALLSDAFFAMGGGKKLVALLKERLVQVITDRLSSGQQHENDNSDPENSMENMRVKITTVDLAKKVPSIKKITVKSGGPHYVNFLVDWSLEGGWRIGLSLRVFGQRRRMIGATLALGKLASAQTLLRLKLTEQPEQPQVVWSSIPMPPFDIQLSYGERNLRRVSTFVHVLMESMLRTKMPCWPLQRGLKVVCKKEESSCTVATPSIGSFLESFDAIPKIYRIRIELQAKSECRKKSMSTSQLSRDYNIDNEQLWTVTIGQETHRLPCTIGSIIVVEGDDVKLTFSKAKLAHHRSHSMVDLPKQIQDIEQTQDSATHQLDLLKYSHNVTLEHSLDAIVTIERSHLIQADWETFSVGVMQEQFNAERADPIVNRVTWRNVKYVLGRIYRGVDSPFPVVTGQDLVDSDGKSLVDEVLESVTDITTKHQSNKVDSMLVQGRMVEFPSERLQLFRSLLQSCAASANKQIVHALEALCEDADIEEEATVNSMIRETIAIPELDENIRNELKSLVEDVPCESPFANTTDSSSKLTLGQFFQANQGENGFQLIPVQEEHEAPISMGYVSELSLLYRTDRVRGWAIKKPFWRLGTVALEVDEESSTTDKLFVKQPQQSQKNGIIGLKDRRVDGVDDGHLVYGMLAGQLHVLLRLKDPGFIPADFIKGVQLLYGYNTSDSPEETILGVRIRVVWPVTARLLRAATDETITSTVGYLLTSESISTLRSVYAKCRIGWMIDRTALKSSPKLHFPSKSQYGGMNFKCSVWHDYVHRSPGTLYITSHVVIFEPDSPQNNQPSTHDSLPDFILVIPRMQILGARYSKRLMLFRGIQVEVSSSPSMSANLAQAASSPISEDSGEIVAGKTKYYFHGFVNGEMDRVLALLKARK